MRIKKIALWIPLLAALLFSPSCKKEVCLKCTTTINGVETAQPELCDTDKDILNAQEEEYRALITEFVEDGWDAGIRCIRQ